MPKKVTHEDFVNKLHIVNPNVEVLDKYKKAIEKIRFKCLIDGTIFSSTPNNMLRGHGCPICGMKKGTANAQETKRKINYKTLIGNKRPNLSKCLKNKDDAFKYGYTSRKEIEWICPDCGFEVIKAPGDFISDHFVCPNCIKNDSYPNRFMFDVLKQLEVNFTREYSPEWIHPMRYDFYIEEKNLIIEMDGGFHRDPEVKRNDVYKDKKAKEHKLNIIRIDCDYVKLDRRFNFIRQNIIQSDIQNYIDLSNVNWDDANIFAMKNEVSHVCELWEKYHDLDKICKETKLILYTVKKYLNFAADNNMTTYDHKKCMEDRKKQRILDGRFARSVAVFCNETGEFFSNMTIPSKKYKCNVGSYFYQNRTYAGILDDGTKLTWRKADENDRELFKTKTKIQTNTKGSTS